MKIRILGAHNCESKSTRCACLLVDENLALDAGALTALSIEEQQKIKTIMLTHQHYDHIRDIPAIALNFYHRGTGFNVYASAEVRAIIENHLLNGQVYPRFQALPSERPTVSFNLVTPCTSQRVNGHHILSIPMNHGVATLGYQVSDAAGRTLFYTSDTGPGLSRCWHHLSPTLLVIEVTLPNNQEEFARKTGHLTPNLLQVEMAKFRELKGYLPRIIVVHMDPTQEKEIEAEIGAVARSLETSIILGREGMELVV